MTLRRFLVVLVLSIAAEAAVFAWRYDDLLFLRHPVDRIVTGPSETFERHAAAALERRRLTRRHLETLSAAAARLGLPDLEARALSRRAEGDPGDRQVRLRLADALRRAGELARAEGIYLELLRTSEVLP